MRSLLWTSAALLLAISQPPPAQAQSARDLVNQAIAAQGGADALRALKALSIKADATHTEPGQSKAAGGEPRFLGNTTLTIVWDLAHHMGPRHERPGGREEEIHRRDHPLARLRDRRQGCEQADVEHPRRRHAARARARLAHAAARCAGCQERPEGGGQPEARRQEPAR